MKFLDSNPFSSTQWIGTTKQEEQDEIETEDRSKLGSWSQPSQFVPKYPLLESKTPITELPKTLYLTSPPQSIFKGDIVSDLVLSMNLRV